MLILRCSLRELKPQIAAVLHIVDEEFVNIGCETTVLTSCWREHGEGSVHPYGYAADFDSAQMPEDLNDHRWQSLKVHLKERLGKEYDVVVHGPKAHVHVEWDPRRKDTGAVRV